MLTISDRIGHALPAMTLRVYGHMIRTPTSGAPEIMEEMFSRERTD
jgi:hypothetical protein